MQQSLKLLFVRFGYFLFHNMEIRWKEGMQMDFKCKNQIFWKGLDYAYPLQEHKIPTASPVRPGEQGEP